MVACVLLRRAFLGYFDSDLLESTALENRLSRASSLFRLWCLANKKSPNICSFTRGNLNYESKKVFLFDQAKGSDVTLLLMLLECQTGIFLRNPKSPDDLVCLRAFSQTIWGGLTYVGTLHGHGLFMTKACAQVQMRAGYMYLRGYCYLADLSTRMGLAGFRLRPKLHYLHHLLLDTQMQIDNGAQYILSPSCFLCESNEDYIGRLSRLSRRVSPRATSLRVAQRYLIKVKCLIDRLNRRSLRQP